MIQPGNHTLSAVNCLIFLLSASFAKNQYFWKFSFGHPFRKGKLAKGSMA